MHKKDNCDLQIDLVFKCNDFSILSNHFLIKHDNLIFENAILREDALEIT